jgi:hypothetical protein
VCGLEARAGAILSLSVVLAFVVVLGLDLLLLLRGRLLSGLARRDRPSDVGGFVVLLLRQPKPEFRPLNERGARLLGRG